MTFFSIKSPAFWVWFVFCAFGVFHNAPLITLSISDGGIYGAGALLFAGLIVFPITMFLRWLDVLDQEPMQNVLAALIWGGLAATAAAAFANDALVSLLGNVVSEDSGWQAAVIAPATEEILKVLVVVLLIVGARKDIHGIMDGVIYGAFAGLGFEVVENLLYYFNWLQAGIEQGAGPTSGLDVLAARTYFALTGSHVAWTALVGAVVLYAAHYTREPLLRRVGVLCGGLLAAGVLHASWNSPLLEELPDTLYILRGLPTLLTFLFLLGWTASHENELLIKVTKTLPKGLISNKEGQDLVGPLQRLRQAASRMRMPEKQRKQAIGLRNAQLALVRAVILDYPKSVVAARIRAVKASRT